MAEREGFERLFLFVLKDFNNLQVYQVSEIPSYGKVCVCFVYKTIAHWWRWEKFTPGILRCRICAPQSSAALLSPRFS